MSIINKKIFQLSFIITMIGSLIASLISAIFNIIFKVGDTTKIVLISFVSTTIAIVFIILIIAKGFKQSIFGPNL